MPAIGKNILRARKTLGWSQEELARRVGYKTKSSIQKIENGLADIPQRKIAEFADVLGTSPAALLGLLDEDEQKENDTTANIVVRMRTDESFRDAVEFIYQLDEESLERALAVLRLL